MEAASSNNWTTRNYQNIRDNKLLLEYAKTHKIILGSFISVWSAQSAGYFSAYALQQGETVVAFKCCDDLSSYFEQLFFILLIIISY